MTEDHEGQSRNAERPSIPQTAAPRRCHELRLRQDRLSSMHNLDFGFYFSIARRRLPLVLLVTLVALLATVLVVRFKKPVYTASAKLLVEAPQIPTDLAKSTVPMG